MSRYYARACRIRRDHGGLEPRGWGKERKTIASRVGVGTAVCGEWECLVVCAESRVGKENTRQTNNRERCLTGNDRYIYIYIYINIHALGA